MHRGKAAYPGKQTPTGATGEGTTGTLEIRAAARGNTLAADTASEAAKPPGDTPQTSSKILSWLKGARARIL